MCSTRTPQRLTSSLLSGPSSAEAPGLAATAQGQDVPSSLKGAAAHHAKMLRPLFPGGGAEPLPATFLRSETPTPALGELAWSLAPTPVGPRAGPVSRGASACHPLTGGALQLLTALKVGGLPSPAPRQAASSTRTTNNHTLPFRLRVCQPCLPSLSLCPSVVVTGWQPACALGKIRKRRSFLQKVSCTCRNIVVTCSEFIRAQRFSVRKLL